MNPTTSTSQELVIYLDHEIGILRYYGTRAMLEDEGVIPANFKWPTGYDALYWESGKFKYWLSRKRPEGAKGPRKDFVDCDYWSLGWVPIGGPDTTQRRIANKAKDLADEIYQWTPKGRAEWARNYNRHQEAIRDEKFQAFKTLIPGLVAPKRGRLSKAITQQGESA
jgi:hypothetical protein